MRDKGHRASWRRKWYAENADRLQTKARAKRKTSDGWAAWCLYAAKRRATKAGVVFALKAKDIDVPERCPITQRVFSFDNSDDNPSLDRLNPAMGYVPGSVRVISKGANRAKNDVTDPALFDRLAAYMRGEI